MKLVEILAKELGEWPESAVCITQDSGGSIYGWEQAGAEYRKYAWYSPDGEDFGMHDIEIEDHDESSDHKKSVVSQAQWQAERERQKGGEWKRHRGGKCPVKAGTQVSTKHRDGKVVEVHHHTAQTGSSIASLNGVWKHNGDSFDIMSYRVISQPQAEEVEMIKVDPVVAANVEAFNGQLQIGRVDGPLVWRDTVNELDAYIEEFTREREALINRLALEGFALIPAMTAVMGVADVDMSDWRNWKSGDIIECLTDSYRGVYTKGQQYKVKSVNRDDFDVFDDLGEQSSCGWDYADCDGLKFVSRP